MSDITAEQETALTIPDTEPLEAVASLSADVARGKIADAIETIASAADQADLVRAVATLEHADNHIAQLQEANELIMQATRTLHQVAVKLQEQRDEVTGERDEARSFARRAWDEGLNHIYECSDCHMAMEEYILEGYAEGEFDESDWYIDHLREVGESALADECDTAFKALFAAMSDYLALHNRAYDALQKHAERPKAHVNPPVVDGVEPMDEDAYFDAQMSGEVYGEDEDADDPDELFDENEDEEADDDNDADDSISPDD